MRKVKSLVKSLLGHKPAFLTIDTVTKTTEGYFISGWYFTDTVVSVNVIDKETKKAVGAPPVDVERSDVHAATGRSATGFELWWVSDKEISDYLLSVVKKDQSTETQPLSIVGQHPLSVSSDTPIQSSSISLRDLKGAAEIVITSDDYVFVSGWLLDGNRSEDITLVNEKKQPVGELQDTLRIGRSDVADTFGHSEKSRQCGFQMLFRLNSQDNSFKRVSVKGSVDGEPFLLPAEHLYKASAEPMTNAMRLLNLWHPHDQSHLLKANIFSTMLREIYPADKTTTGAKRDFNRKVESPVASIIIPLYGRYDFLRYQISYCAAHSKTQNFEIIYVVDDPKIAAKTLDLASEMATITAVSFSVVILEENVGFGKANNIGASFASSDILVLMNSDILPKSQDWLEKLVDIARQPETGIVGARLLYEDESLQHDGMATMNLSEYPGLFFNDHPRKGWPVSLSPFDKKVSECQMITAACWALKKADFELVGGFKGDYVLGDFEDSDLCLQMLEMGRLNFIRRDVELYHLERQSQNLVQPGRWKHNITILNAVHFNTKWKDRLSSMAEAGQ